MNVPDAVREFLKLHAVEGAGVVAVSGGPDSVALLRALHEVHREPLIVAHVNHQLRGSESDADEDFASELAASLKLEFRTVRLTIPSNENLEGAARRLRYDWLHSLGSNWIATGHTADDQAETVLHRLIRGSGLQGLRGIATAKVSRDAESAERSAGGGATSALRSEASALFVANDDGPPRSAPEASALFVANDDGPPRSAPEASALFVANDDGPPRSAPEASASRLTRRVIRPLIRVSRSDVMNYLTSLNQPARTDSSNLDQRFTRNRIRHELLPLMKEFNPEMVAVLNRLAEHAGAAFDFIETHAAELLERAERPRAGDMLIFDKPTLEAASPFLLRETFRLVWRREGWPMDAMTAAHWQRAAKLVVGDYPNGVRLRVVGRVVQVWLNRIAQLPSNKLAE